MTGCRLPSSLQYYYALATMAEQNESIRKAVECPVCLEAYWQPRMLTCAHTFCTDCLASLETRSHRVTCPVCRAETPGAVAELPKAFALIELMKAMGISGEEPRRKRREDLKPGDPPLVPTAPPAVGTKAPVINPPPSWINIYEFWFSDTRTGSDLPTYPFSVALTVSGGSMAGCGADNIGLFVLLGTAGRGMKFQKRYRDKEARHVVDYEGQGQWDGELLLSGSGEWKIGSAKGVWGIELKTKQEMPPWLHNYKTWFADPRMKTPTELHLAMTSGACVKNADVTADRGSVTDYLVGLGYDDVGAFIVSGRLADSKIEYVKCYRTHEVVYKGVTEPAVMPVSSASGNWSIRKLTGTWGMELIQ